jgi:hypothetical protein
MSILNAFDRLAAKGFILNGHGETDLTTMTTTYSVTRPDGQTVRMTAKEIKAI